MNSPVISPNLERFAGRSVLVTGASGFIGRRLVSVLLAHRAHITLLQRTPEPSTFPSDILLLDFAAPDFEHRIAAAWGPRRFDAVFNLAAHGVTRSADSSPEECRRQRLLARQVNVDAALALFRHAQATDSGVFVQAGTCSEYAPSVGAAPRIETDPVERRIDQNSVIYGASKAQATGALLDAARSGALPLVVARIFNVYGPGEKSQRLLPSLVHYLSHGRRVSLSAGRQIKDYLHLDDVVEGLCALALAAKDQRFQGVLNLSSGSPVSVAEFARTVAGAIGDCEHLLGFGERPTHPDEVPVLIGSTAARDAFTEWRPRQSLKASLSATVREMMQSKD